MLVTRVGSELRALDRTPSERFSHFSPTEVVCRAGNENNIVMQTIFDN